MLYDFRCPDGHTFEVRMSMHSITTYEPICPVCGMESARVFIAAPAQATRMPWWDVAFGKETEQKRTPIRAKSRR